MILTDFIRKVPNFPCPGVVYRDITPLLNNAKATEYCLNQLLELLGNQKIDKVVGIESRGFFFGILLAQKLKVGFVPVRKPGKLPYEVLKETYSLEYGNDALEIHKDAIHQGERVLMHDDVLATGGTAKAACTLIESLGGIVVQCNFLLEIKALEGRSKLKGHSIESLLPY